MNLYDIVGRKDQRRRPNGRAKLEALAERLKQRLAGKKTGRRKKVK